MERALRTGLSFYLVTIFSTRAASLSVSNFQESKKRSAKFSSISSVNSPSTNSFRFVHNYFGRWLTHFELGTRFLDLRSLFFKLGCERLYLLLLLRDRCLQVLNFRIEHGL